MRYKQPKKVSKQEVSHVVPHDLISGNRFNDIVTLLKGKTELSNRDRYLYGYSLLQIENELEALVALWPLASKNQIQLQEDCASIATHVFKDEQFLMSASLSDEALFTLWTSARHLIPKSHLYNTLKQRLFNSLWEKADYEKLERLIKDSKEDELPGSWVENLSKLAFFQPKSKLSGNPSIFISHILTGGACLIARNPIYRNDIDEAIHSLANELKRLYAQLKTDGKQKLAWATPLFDDFVDYEASIVIKALQLATNHNGKKLEIIPTPSYLITQDLNGRVSQQFLPWLEVENRPLFDMYQSTVHQAVLWALGGEKLSEIISVLKSSTQNKFHPYLRLAIMLRAESIKKSALNGLVEISEFKGANEEGSLIKQVAIQTIHSLLNEGAQKISSDIWQLLFKFYPVIQNHEIRNALITLLINKLHKRSQCQDELHLPEFKSLAYQMNEFELEKDLDALITRQHACKTFLATFDDERKSKKIIKTIKTLPSLLEHLTFIADTCLLVSPDESEWLLWHVEALVQNKKINSFIALNDLFSNHFAYDYFDAEQLYFRNDILDMAKTLNLPVSCLPDLCSYINLQSISKLSIHKLGVLSQADPFKTLDVTFNDSKPIIMQKVMKLIQQSPDKMALFRQAQSELFNPGQRFLHHYFHYLSLENSGAEQPSLLKPLPLKDIPLRHEILNA